MPTEYTIDAKPPPPLPPPYEDSVAVGVSESGVLLNNEATIPMPMMHHQKHALEAQTGPTTIPPHDSKKNSSGNSATKRKRTSHYTEPPGPLPQGLPYNITDYPELQLDPTNTDHSKLVHAFKEPIFYNKPSQVLTIAYSHHTAAVEERKRIRAKKKATLHELQDIRKEFMTKKQELLYMNTKLKASTKKVGQWTNKVFELELKEPNCLFNDKLHKLQNYVNKYGKIPENHKKIHGSGEEKEIAAFVSNVRNKVKKGEDCTMVAKYPHRKRALEECGIQWESEHDTRFETMFNKLIEYKREHGTFRMPSTDLIKESGDKELIELRNWVFSQVNVFRYHLQGKKVEHVKRFIDAGFSFEHYYATAGHVYDRDTPPFDAICKRFVANGGIVDPDDAKLLEAASNKSPKKGKKRGPNKKKRKKKGEDIQEVEKLKLDGDTVDAVGTRELNADETIVVAEAEEAAMEVAVAEE